MMCLKKSCSIFLLLAFELLSSVSCKTSSKSPPAQDRSSVTSGTVTAQGLFLTGDDTENLLKQAAGADKQPLRELLTYISEHPYNINATKFYRLTLLPLMQSTPCCDGAKWSEVLAGPITSLAENYSSLRLQISELSTKLLGKNPSLDTQVQTLLNGMLRNSESSETAIVLKQLQSAKTPSDITSVLKSPLATLLTTNPIKDKIAEAVLEQNGALLFDKTFDAIINEDFYPGEPWKQILSEEQVKNMHDNITSAYDSLTNVMKVEFLKKFMALTSVDKMMLTLMTTSGKMDFNEFLRGGHFIIEDGGALLTTMEKSFPGAMHDRTSSHYKVETNGFKAVGGQRGIFPKSSSLFPELLMGKIEKNGVEYSWIQVEKHGMSALTPVESLLHITDYFTHVNSGKMQVGAFGFSKYSEKNTNYNKEGDYIAMKAPPADLQKALNNRPSFTDDDSTRQVRFTEIASSLGAAVGSLAAGTILGVAGGELIVNSTAKSGNP